MTGEHQDFKDSNVNNLVTSDQANISRKTGDGRREFDCERDLTQRGANLLDQDRLDFAEATKHLASGPANE